RTVGENHTSWSDKLDDALWAFHTTYKTLIRCTPYKLVYGKSCHLPIELEHRAYWALKHVNFDLKTVGDHRKLKTRWSGPFTITRVFPYGTIELCQPNGLNFKVNGHHVKHYFGGDIPSNVASDLHTALGYMVQIRLVHFCLKEPKVEVINTAKLIINVAQDSADGDILTTASVATVVCAATTTTATITTVGDITLAQALEEIKSTKPKEKGIDIQELEPVKPMKMKDQIRLDEEADLKLQAAFDKEERLAREKVEKLEEANIALIKTWDDIHAKIDDDHQLAKRMQAQEQEETEEKRNKPPTKAQQRKIMCTYLKNMEGYKLTDLKLKEFDSIQEMFDRAFKRVNKFEDFRTELVKGKENKAGTWLIQESIKKQKKIYKEGRKGYYQIMIGNEKSQMYMVFSQMLKSFNREDLEDMYKLIKAKYESTRPIEDLDLLLWGDLKSIFEPRVEDEVGNASTCVVLELHQLHNCLHRTLIRKASSSQGQPRSKLLERNSIEGQILANFLAETPPKKEKEVKNREAKRREPESENTWRLFTDGSSSSDGSRAGLMLVDPEGKEYTYALRSEIALTFEGSALIPHYTHWQNINSIPSSF
nr:hypothetical protein [Tanacetum cinerariifolium]